MAVSGRGAPCAFGPRDVLGVALPMILANVSVPLVGLADSAAVGHLDQPHSLAGVAVGATIFSVLFAVLAAYLPAWWLLRPFDNHGLWASFLVFLAARGLAQAWVLSRRLRAGIL